MFRKGNADCAGYRYFCRACAARKMDNRSCSGAACNYTDNNPLPLTDYCGGFVMKIVVVDNPKFFSFFLRKMFGIKRLPKDSQC